MSGPRTRHVGETAAGELYMLTVERPCLCLDVGGGESRLPIARLTLTPDEARALAADLQRWAGHAEREGKRTPP